MPRVMVTTLRPASGGFGQYDWVEATHLEGAEELSDYEAVCQDNGESATPTEELDGRIRNQQGTVYKFDRSYNAGGELIEDTHYEMVWVEDEEGGNQP
jgi:hypothetical protein